MYEFLSIKLIVFGVLQIILFFKMWGMTNDVSKIRDLLEARLTEFQTVKEQPKNFNNETDIKSSKVAVKAELPNDINIGDNVIRISDGKSMIVDSIDDGQYFCKGSFMEGYSYYKRDEIEKKDSTRPKTIM